MKQFNSVEYMLEGIDGFQQAKKNEKLRRDKVTTILTLVVILLVTGFLCL